MWQTSDGATHALINRGTLVQAGTSLRLFSSFDSGQSWVVKSWLGNTNKYSTSDGVLVGNDLWLVYASANGKILFSILHYDSSLRTWSLVKTETVFTSSDSQAINPALAIDDQGAVWCAFVNLDNATADANIKLVQRAPDGSAWQDTGLVFGPTDNVSVERSARPVVISNGVGMVYTVHESIYWAYRLDGWPATTPWIEQTLFTSTPPYDIDPYASHFSVVADANRNLHMATVDHGRLLYFRFVNRTQAWNPVRTLTNDIQATYPQVSIAKDRLAIFVNASTFVKVLQSTNTGSTFTYTDLLTHDPAPQGGSISYQNSRIETPGYSFDPIPVFQQYADGATLRVMYFQVPVITP